MRPRALALVGSVAACALLSGCFGSSSPEPTASHGHHHRRDTSAPTVSPSTPSPSVSSSPPATAGPVVFSPKSGGKHLDDCQRLVPGDDPAQFVYYPVLLKTSAPVTLDSVATDHTQGVVDAASWVAPAGSTPETGTLKGWPPGTIVTKDTNLNWATRVPATGASLEPATGWYNVFLRLKVDPTPGDSAVNGLQVTYHDANGASTTATWKAQTTFSMSC